MQAHEDLETELETLRQQRDTLQNATLRLESELEAAQGDTQGHRAGLDERLKLERDLADAKAECTALQAKVEEATSRDGVAQYDHEVTTRHTSLAWIEPPRGGSEGTLESPLTNPCL